MFEFARVLGISLWKFSNADSLLSCFRIPMSRQAYNKFLELKDELLLMEPILPNANDC